MVYYGDSVIKIQEELNDQCGGSAAQAAARRERYRTRGPSRGTEGRVLEIGSSPGIHRRAVPLGRRSHHLRREHRGSSPMMAPSKFEIPCPSFLVPSIFDIQHSTFLAAGSYVADLRCDYLRTPGAVAVCPSTITDLLSPSRPSRAPETKCTSYRHDQRARSSPRLPGRPLRG